MSIFFSYPPTEMKVAMARAMVNVMPELKSKIEGCLGYVSS